MIQSPERSAVKSGVELVPPNGSSELRAAMTVRRQLPVPFPIRQTKATTLIPWHSPSITFETEVARSIGVPLSESESGIAPPSGVSQRIHYQQFGKATADPWLRSG